MERMYGDLASWWPLISPYEGYADEAGFFLQVLKETGLPESPSLLELGSGGGSNAYYMKKVFSPVTLSDLSEGMLEQSRALNPECEHVEGDMRTLRLGRTFDVVFIHDAIDYMLTLDDLRRAMETAYVHCKPGGAALFVPDHVRETFEESTDHDGNDGEGRSIRYLEWNYDPDENDTLCSVEYVYVLRDGDQPVQVLHDHHTCGLFPRDEWLRLLKETAFETTIVPDHYDRELFVARRR
jgi:trans-aconitate methyltransferase